MSWSATSQTARAIGFGGRQVGRFATANQGPLEAMGGAALAMGGAALMPAAIMADLLGSGVAAGYDRFSGTAGTTAAELGKRTLKATPDFVVNSAKRTGRALYGASNRFSKPMVSGIESAERSLLNMWEPHKGARKTLGASLMGGAIFGTALSSFKFNREIAPEVMARAEEGSAYESGPGAFGSGSGGKMPYASGRATLGMHRRRHG